MTKQNKSKPLLRKRIDHSSSTSDNEYDLEKNIKRISSLSRSSNGKGKNRKYNHTTDNRNSEEQFLRSNGYIESPQPISSMRTGDIPWDSYIRLDDKITDFKDKNNQAHNELRIELENKIKDASKDCKDAIAKRLPIQWYNWTIVGIVTIVSIWYLFSYSDIHPLSNKVKEIDKRINHIEKTITTIKDSISEGKSIYN